MNAQKIVEIAKKYIGKTEKPSNSGFTDAEFEQRMKDTGWSKGLSWCAFFCELVFKEAYSSADISVRKSINALFSGSATTTFKNFDLDKEWQTGKTPKPGALAVWRQGTGWQGHIGIVSAVVDANTFLCVEGNTNDKGGREGYIVAEKKRLVSQPFKKNGLNLIGFVYPREI